MLYIRSHVGVGCIFAMVWVLLNHIIVNYITNFPEVNNVVVLPCLVDLYF